MNRPPPDPAEEQRRRLVSILTVTLTDVEGFGVKLRGLALKAQTLQAAFLVLGLREDTSGNVYRWTHPEVEGLVVDGRIFKLAAETTTPDELRGMIKELFDGYEALTGRAAPPTAGKCSCNRCGRAARSTTCSKAWRTAGVCF